MDFAALPPEINSGRMYSGPGCGSMLAAAAAWDGLAADLYSTAACYQSVILDLTSAAWLGPASVAMTTATAPYVSWMTTTAALCEQTAAQARAAATAYENAFAMTVPPPMIAANRAQLMSLITTNILGQNTPAIAATEAHYGDMWAQDATAMYGYAGASATAATLDPFMPPPQTTNPAGLAVQGAAVAHATATPAASHGPTIISTVPQLISTMPHALQELAAPVSPTSSTSGLSGILAGPQRVVPYIGSKPIDALHGGPGHDQPRLNLGEQNGWHDGYVDGKRDAGIDASTRDRPGERANSNTVHRPRRGRVGGIGRVWRGRLDRDPVGPD